MDYLRYYTGVAMQVVGIAGILIGGPFAWAGASTLLVLAAVDPLLGTDRRRRRIRSPHLVFLPVYLCVLLGPAIHFAAAWKLRQGGVGTAEFLGMVVSAAWLGVVPVVPALHELYHKRNKLYRFLGTYLQVPYMDCTRSVAHMLGHHLHVGTRKDPDTALRGENLYRFIWRTIPENYRELYALEKSSMARRGASVWSWQSILPRAAAAYLLFLLLLGLVGGWMAVGMGLAATGVARLWVEAFNYFQHAGLIRVEGTPIAGRHVWNHLSPIVRTAGFEITNHCEHHLDASVPFHELEPDVEGPQMPSIFLCFLAALVPPVWNRLILFPRLEHWDRHHATPEERALARAANREARWPDWYDGVASPDAEQVGATP